MIFRPPGRMHDFGVELHGVEAPLRVVHGGDGAVLRRGGNLKAGRGGFDGVAVAHPADQFGVQPLEHDGRVEHVQPRLAEFFQRGAAHGPAEVMGHRLHPVADAEQGQTQGVDSGVNLGSARLVDRRRPARQDQPDGVSGADDVEGRVAGQNLAVDAALADAPGDELRVLRAEIQDDDQLVGRERVAHVGPARGVVGQYRLVLVLWCQGHISSSAPVPRIGPSAHCEFQ